MMMSGQTRSCLSAVIMLLAAALQVDGFVCPAAPVVAARSTPSMSSLTEGSSSRVAQKSRWTTASSKLSSTYAEYLESRAKTAALPPAEKEKSLFEEYTQAKVSVPGASASAPAPAASAPAAAQPAKELSPYEEYMASKNKVKAVEAATTFEEKAKATVYGDYMAARAEQEGEAPADCAEEECNADEIEEQGGLFASYMASRGVKVEAAPEIECEEEECSAEEEVSFYESYMRSRNKVTEASATVTPQEVETVSEFDSYTAARAEKEAAQAAMPPAQKEASMFEDYRATQSSSSESSKTPAGHKGTGGMADTRDPAPVNHSDPRKSISAAPSFAEYLKSKKN